MLRHGLHPKQALWDGHAQNPVGTSWRASWAPPTVQKVCGKLHRCHKAAAASSCSCTLNLALETGRTGLKLLEGELAAPSVPAAEFLRRIAYEGTA